MTISRRFLLLCVTILFTTTVFGQNTRSAVSISGNDLNACTVPSPCRTFAAAMAVTNSAASSLR